jgi:3-oxoadipate enol-lactonase
MSQLTFDSSGQGDPVVLIHGFPLTSKMWAHQRENLATHRRRVITPDLPGFGGSPAGARSLDDYANAVREFLDSQGIDRCVLGGFSMGGYVAMALLRSHPDRVRGLILVDTRAEPDTDEGRKGRYAMAERAQAEGKSVVIESLMPRLVADATFNGRADVVHEVLEAEAGATLEGIVDALNAMAVRPSAVDLLPKIAVPTLVVVGKEDALTPPDVAQRMVDAIPDAQLVVVPDAGHMTPMEQPDVVTRAIGEWLVTHEW